jgi:prepilin-type N-terminal cleavage/methylation domain-containing protein
MKKRKGFTLLEMLIVLGIIATILGVLSVSFSTTQKKSRDAKRKSDLKALQSGLEQYYATCGFVYPANIDSGIVCGASPPIISLVPVDPKTITPYPYSPTGTTPNFEGFSVCTDQMESETSTNYCLYSQQ